MARQNAPVGNLKFNGTSPGAACTGREGPSGPHFPPEGTGELRAHGKILTAYFYFNANKLALLLISN